ncbi:hypothetical protein MTO96_039629 [Rhipicephalus appendiculatus]
MIEEDAIPFSFSETGWTDDFLRFTVTVDDVWRYLHSSTHTVRQAHRGWALKEENYKMNLETGDGRYRLVRAACSPSIKSGVYLVSTWFDRVTGSIAGAHCECIAG